MSFVSSLGPSAHSSLNPLCHVHAAYMKGLLSNTFLNCLVRSARPFSIAMIAVLNLQRKLYLPALELRDHVFLTKWENLSTRVRTHMFCEPAWIFQTLNPYEFRVHLSPCELSTFWALSPVWVLNPSELRVHLNSESILSFRSTENWKWLWRRWELKTQKKPC